MEQPTAEQQPEDTGSEVLKLWLHSRVEGYPVLALGSYTYETVRGLKSIICKIIQDGVRVRYIAERYCLPFTSRCRQPVLAC